MAAPPRPRIKHLLFLFTVIGSAQGFHLPNRSIQSPPSTQTSFTSHATKHTDHDIDTQSRGPHGWLDTDIVSSNQSMDSHGTHGMSNPMDSSSCSSTTTTKNRRSFLSQLAAVSIPTIPTIPTIVGSSSFLPPAHAISIPLIPTTERRQLELCLVTVLRTEYWAKAVSSSLQTKLLSPPPPPTLDGNTDNTDNTERTERTELTEYQKKQPYLEARLGAKALLTKKIGGGANAAVLKLAAFDLKSCLDDGKYWCKELSKGSKNTQPSSQSQQSSQSSLYLSKSICNSELSSASEDLVESLASLVEFDGLETTIDPSPRSSLMLSMYNSSKGTFVYRTLNERVIPSCERYLNVFGRERRGVVEEFVRKNYGNEFGSR